MVNGVKDRPVDDDQPDARVDQPEAHPEKEERNDEELAGNRVPTKR